MNVEELRTKEKHKPFHRSRVMFCIKDGEIVIAPKGKEMSHLEWFESEDWVTENTVADFLNTTIRGNYRTDENKVFFYKGVGFFFDEEMKRAVLNLLPKLVLALKLKLTTHILLGPNERVINNVKYKQEDLGTVEELR